MTTLEKIEQKGGRLHTAGDYSLAHEKAADAPQDLTDLDLAVLEFFGGDREAASARAAREKALHPPPADPPAATIAAVLARLVNSMKASNEKNTEHTARIDAFEQRQRGFEADRHEHRIKRIAMSDFHTRVLIDYKDLAAAYALLTTRMDALEVSTNSQFFALETRVIDGIEARTADARGPGVDYKGVFNPGTAYPKGSLVTKAGGLWLSLADTTRIPGSDPTQWKLVVKSGGA